MITREVIRRQEIKRKWKIYRNKRDDGRIKEEREEKRFSKKCWKRRRVRKVWLIIDKREE
jgi:hypothetical protein